MGIGSSPLYISFNRGNTTLGSGEVSGFGYILPEDFEQEAFTQIYIMVHESGDVISYTDAYDNLIRKIQKRVEGIEKSSAACVTMRSSQKPMRNWMTPEKSLRTEKGIRRKAFRCEERAGRGPEKYDDGKKSTRMVNSSSVTQKTADRW